MFSKRRILLFGLLMALMVMTVAGSASAVGNVALVGTGWDAWGFWFNVNVLGTDDDDGWGYDYFAFVCYNADGEVTDVSQWWISVGFETVIMDRCWGNLADLVQPITVDMRDIVATTWLPNTASAMLAFPSVLSFNSVDAPLGAQIPNGYIQHHIVCDTPVYDGPGGTPVGDNMVTAGQAWHVSPTPEPGLDGQNWTAIFVGGAQIGYIPTGCVGEPTEFGAMAMYE
jgi:hypothetical protein